MHSFDTVDYLVVRMFPAKLVNQARLDIAEDKTVTDLFRQYCRDESGATRATGIEYGLCCTILLGALIAIVGTGGSVDAMYQSLMAIVAAMS